MSEAKDHKNLRLAISCGGTGGHFYPGMSIAKILKSEGGKVLLLLSGVHAVRQKEIAEDNGIEAVALPDMPSPRKIKNIFKFIKGFLSGTVIAGRALTEHKIDVVLGMGSFTSLPPILAARKLKKEIYLHDGNARIGRANRYLSRYAKHLWSAFDAVNADKIKCDYSVIGMPIRPELTYGRRYTKEEAAAEINSRFGSSLSADVTTLLIFGGSQGAQKINTVLPDFLKTLPADRCQVIHLSGPGKLEETRKAYEGCNIRHLLLESSSEMQLMYGCADFVISRSGGSTVAEIAFFGKASLLIPYPFAAENHQFDNACFLQKSGGAIVLDNKDCSSERFAEILQGMLDSPETVAEMGRKAHSYHTHDAVREILDAIS